jgi:translation initiation factor RLI1
MDIYPQNVGRKLENFPSPKSFSLSSLKIRIMAVPTQGDTVIAVMGITGVGKSTFIANATGQDVRIGHSLKSCQYYSLKQNSQTHKPQAPKSPRYSRARLTAAEYSLSILLDLMIVACATMPISWR